MKVIVAGSRTITDMAVVDRAIREGMAFFKAQPTEIVSGGAAGVDTLGEAWARQHGFSVKRFPAQWAKYGKAAGPKRNEEMAAYADALIAVWNGMSRGTSNMICNARARGLPVFIAHVEAPI